MDYNYVRCINYIVNFLYVNPHQTPSPADRRPVGLSDGTPDPRPNQAKVLKWGKGTVALAHKTTRG